MRSTTVRSVRVMRAHPRDVVCARASCLDAEELSIRERD
jgi:hypothetical protein